MAKHVPFVHLHFHTEYSLLDSACQVKKTIKRAVELEMGALAITDHGVLYGAIEFYKEAKAAGIKPILGCEVYVATGSRHDRKATESGKQPNNHLVLLAEDEHGWANLIKLVSLAHLEGFYYKPRIDKELLAQHARGLIGLSSCLKGEPAEHCVAGRLDAAQRAAGHYAEILGKGNYFLELQNHGLPEQAKANAGLREVARALNLPLICTNDVHYLQREHAEAHEVLLCLQTQNKLSDTDRMHYHGDQFYMKSGTEMQALFPDEPELLARTVEIGQRCNVDLRLGKELHFPVYKTPAGVTQKELIIQIGHAGLRQRYNIADCRQPTNDFEKKAITRFDYELSVIEKTGFINYYLVVWDFIHHAKEIGIPVGPGRGSGAGSIIAYAMGITNIEPLRFNLIFERFLNPERISAPDFDIDFCQRRRGEVIDYVRNKYGAENVAQIVTFGTLGPKTVIRDIGRVLDVPLGECDRLAKMVPEDPKIDLEKALQQNPEFKQVCERDENARRIMKYARVLEGLARNPGVHAAGVVIGEKPLMELLPLARSKDKEIITQYEMVPLEATGLLKMDFLGLKTLTVIQDAVTYVQRNHAVKLDIDTISLEDTQTYELLSRGDAVGVFQLESGGMRDLLRRMGSNKIEDLIALIALYRPGPMQFIDSFINRKNGVEAIEYAHPLLEQILQETYGIIVYQEQVQQAANILAGFSLGEGDVLRRAMGKKKPEEMAKMRDKFVAGCQQTNKIPREKAGAIFDTIDKFAAYGFNKSHSAAYAIVAYQTAYLKANYPVEFMAALLTSEIGNPDKLTNFIVEARAMGIEILPPSINESDLHFTPTGKKIRFGLAGIKNVGEGAVEEIIRNRDAAGPFKGLVDFCNRVDGQRANKKVLESLVRCGAFDFTGVPRGRLFAGIDAAMSRAATEQRDRRAGQTSLFGLMGGDDGPHTTNDNELPTGEVWTESQLLAGEKELLGFFISGHPLTQFEWILNRYSLIGEGALEDVPSGTLVRVGGLVSNFQKRFTKKSQEAMGIFRLERLDGAVEAVAFPSTFNAYGVYLKDDAPIMLCGTVGRDDRMGQQQLKITAQEIYSLADAPRHFTESVRVHLPEHQATPENLLRLKELIRQHPGQTPLNIVVLLPSGEKVYVNAHATLKVAPNEAFLRAVQQLLGEDSLYIAPRASVCLKPPAPRRWSSNGGGGEG
ncbi:MAG: DNA polymerase III subunit alpha [Verrucomicrobia bacterium]|nr:MAG: DNA polymerase III subunit alpha [Verrucomicrobiota bacterium]